jgi:flagellar biosynthetic protein FlhB
MAGPENDGQERSHLPTPQRTQRAREQGDVAYSTEITTAATYAAFYAGLTIAGGWCALEVSNTLIAFFRRPEDVGGALFSPFSTAFTSGVAAQLLIAVAPVFGVLALAAIISLVVQRAIVFAPSKLKPKLARISIIDNAKQKWGPNGLFEFAKSFVKLGAILAFIAFAVKVRFLDLPELSASQPRAFFEIVLRETVYFVGLVTAVAIAVAAIDLPWRRFQHQKRLMMTLDELRKESKETEGDPFLKGARRERANAIARNRMFIEIPKANVVIVNPMHYAVALQWERKKGGAPVCVAKGVDEIAARIREVAAANGIPIRRDPPTARSIHALVEIGDEIKREHYAAVAAAIHFAEEVRKKAKMSYAR